MNQLQNQNMDRDRADKPKRRPLFACQECGKKFYSVGAATRASFNGCPKCGGVDVDIFVEGETR